MRSVKRLAIAVGVLAQLSGCGSSNEPSFTTATGSGATTIELEKALTADQAELLLENGRKQMLASISPRELSLAATNLIPFRATSSYASPGTDFLFIFSDGDPPRRISYVGRKQPAYRPTAI